eukprot:Gb_19652 [translate_table: standard]
MATSRVLFSSNMWRLCHFAKQVQASFCTLHCPSGATMSSLDNMAPTLSLLQTDFIPTNHATRTLWLHTLLNNFVANHATSLATFYSITTRLWATYKLGLHTSLGILSPTLPFKGYILLQQFLSSPPVRTLQ